MVGTGDATCVDDPDRLGAVPRLEAAELLWPPDEQAVSKIATSDAHTVITAPRPRVMITPAYLDAR
jgi:hypothetical protein